MYKVVHVYEIMLKRGGKASKITNYTLSVTELNQVY